MFPIITIRIAAAAASFLVIANQRPSTIVRLVEDGVVGTVKVAARSTKRAASSAASRWRHAKDTVRTEYAARRLDAAEETWQQERDRYWSASPEEQARMDAETVLVVQRAQDLARKRQAKSKAHRASHAGS